jgi:hypothetical protein
VISGPGRVAAPGHSVRRPAPVELKTGRLVRAVSTRLYKPLGDWTTDDVRALVDERTEEGQRLEYKRELNLGAREERLEAAKDASGMANASGGLLIYRVEEEELSDGRRIPVRVTPLTSGDAQARLEDVLDGAVSPKLNLAAKMLEVDGGGYLLVVRLLQRFGPLHMVEGYGQNRYFMRGGLATRPMQAHEIERVFSGLTAVESRVDELLRDLPVTTRLAGVRSRSGDLDASARKNERIEPMQEPWVSVTTAAIDAVGAILPMRTPGSNDFSVLEVAQSMTGSWEAVGGVAFEIDSHGYIQETPGGPGLTHRLRLFRKGVFEWGARWIGRGGPGSIYAGEFIRNAHDALVYFASVYQAVGYFGRVRIWVRVDNADLSELVPQGAMSSRSAPVAPSVEALSFTTDTNVERLAEDPLPIVHEAMDLIWQGYGQARCLHFSPKGELLVS